MAHLSPPPGLLVYGDICMDLHLHSSSLEQEGSDTPIEDLHLTPGGSAANCAAAAARLGIPTALIGFVGKDAFGAQCRQDLQSCGVSTEYVYEIEGQTGLVVSVMQPNGEHRFYSYRGANALGRLDSLPELLFEDCNWLHLSGYSFQDELSRGNASRLLELAAGRGLTVSLDPSYWFARQYPSLDLHLLERVDLLFPNLEEAQLLSGEAEALPAARTLLRMGLRRVVVKLGGEGCLLAREDEAELIPAVPVSLVVDTTGAGDAFCGAFLAGCLYGLEPPEAARVGHIAAAQVIQSVGGHTAAPTLEGLIALLRENHAADIAWKIIPRS